MSGFVGPLLLCAALCAHTRASAPSVLDYLGVREDAAARERHGDARRYVHRHEHIGVDADSADHIGCAETEARLLEHMLTPPALWCNAATCLSEFDVAYAVHAIDCDARRCTVLLHCGAGLRYVKWAGAATLGGALCMLLLPLCCSARRRRPHNAAHKCL